MKAIIFTRYGSPDFLQFKEIAKPVPKDNEVLIKMRASSINSWDWEYQSGTYLNRILFGLFRPNRKKQILGADIAGTIERIGKNITRFQPGDEVFGDLWDSWGGFAEYACASENSLELKPANLTFEEAAAIPQAGVLALQGLRKTGQIKPGQKVLINGAGGGVGTFAVQLAMLAGTEVTGVDSTHKLDAIRAIGAGHVIDYTQEDFTQNGQQYDLILDVHGFRSMFDYKRALNPHGTYAMVGGGVSRMLQAVILGLWGSITGGQKFRLVMAEPNKGLTDIIKLVEAGKIVPMVDKIYKLQEVPEALRYFTEGRHKGKIVITMER